MNDAQKFLAALLDGVPSTLWFYLWTLPDKRSAFHRTADLAAAVSGLEAMVGNDVYVGVGLADRNRGRVQRVTAKQVAGITAMWADVDILDGDAHQRKGYPADEAAARDVLDRMGAKPSALVHSGHGLQAWWFLKEPWIFADDADRTNAATLATRWNLTLRVRAAESGCVVDATQDLSRVMRVPGTTNHKGSPVPVRLLNLAAKRRYDPSELHEYLADDSAMTMLAGRRTYQAGDLELHSDAEPPFAKFEALLGNDTKFRQSWERDRRDLDDQSASTYDLSLASIAASCDWTDQEIVDLLIASRRKHRDDLKLRQDYYQRTLSRARDDRSRSIASEEIETTAARVERAAVLGNVNEANRARRELTSQVASLLGIEITRLIRFTQDPPRYRLETPAGSVTIGGADVILSQTRMRAVIADATRIVIPRFKGPKWDEIAQAIFAACEDEDTGIESTDDGIAYAWLIEYLQDRPVLDDRDVAAVTQSPYRDNGCIYVFGPTLRRWLWLSRGDRVSPQRMGEVLRSFGAEHEVVNVTIDEARSTRSVWRVPAFDHDQEVVTP